MNAFFAARLGLLAGVLLILVACGDTFRPIAIPLSPTPPNPANFHYVLSLSTNGSMSNSTIPAESGASTRIDVSGDTNAGVAQLGIGPVHAAILPDGADIYVANEFSDTVSFYAVNDATHVSTVSLPTGSAPVFVNTAENANVYVANSGTGTIAVINAANAFAKIVPLDPDPVTAATFRPVALVETPNASKVYVANQGVGDVSVITTVDQQLQNQIATGATGSSWIVARSDSGRVFVLNDGSVSVIDTSTDTFLGNIPVDGGGNFMFYDKAQNRIFVTSPTADSVTILNATVDPPANAPVRIDLSAAANIPGCPNGCSPVSVAVLPDGSRAYVAAYALPTGGASLNSVVLVINPATQTITKTIPLAAATVNTAATGCDTARFRISIASSTAGEKVYIANCDAGSTAILRTSDDTLMLDINAPAGSFAAQGNIGQPPPQNPVFVLTGQ